jgi:hypothetical protein
MYSVTDLLVAFITYVLSVVESVSTCVMIVSALPIPDTINAGSSMLTVARALCSPAALTSITGISMVHVPAEATYPDAEGVISGKEIAASPYIYPTEDPTSRAGKRIEEVPSTAVFPSEDTMILGNVTPERPSLDVIGVSTEPVEDTVIDGNEISAVDVTLY